MATKGSCNRGVSEGSSSEQPFRIEAARRRPLPPRAALVIPTCNEAEHIASTLTALLDGAEGHGHDQIEIFVVDGGSTDGTPTLFAA
jgi:cellulose synthase/poly-beta-1,6-N-acetylglucosamine synthase-like glycosyltransferase